jgi:hypothetical protein
MAGKMTVQQETEMLLKHYKVKYVTEHKFHPSRKWRFDFAFPEVMIALEIEGGVWTKGRHTRGTGFINDIGKYNEATMMGWRVLRAANIDQAIVAILYIKQCVGKHND